ncbi:MAG TPA: cation diffusion facilitator family transporter [Methanomicrobiales archaeon]|nr:cation diffusion facilitator family transporter [Methanomicrobiales archaeon]
MHSPNTENADKSVRNSQGSEDLCLKKQKTARLSVFSNTALVVLKVIVGIASGSVSILSEALHSGMDLVAAAIAYLSVRKSSEPPDEIHAFGHGKFESVSGFFEALLIFAAAAIIIFESVQKILTGEEGLLLSNLYIGMGVMGFSALANWIVSSRLMRVARESDSIALESDAWHLRTDVYTSLGVFTGLVLIQITGITLLDPLIALSVAAIILRAAYDLTRRSLGDLMDRRLSDAEEDRIRTIICEHASEYADFHALRTRRSGPEQHIDLHVVMRKDLTVEESHDLTEHLESDLRLEFPRASVTIHVEPCGGECDHCPSICRLSGRSRTQGREE